MTDEAHLFVLVHGLWGAPGHMVTVEKVINELLDGVSTERVVTVRPSSFRFWKTYDGIGRCAEQVVSEVFTKMESLQREEGIRVVKISFVGYSLGGLICRHVVGQLYGMGVFEEIKPVIFCTYATPHVGVHFFGGGVLETVANFLGRHVLGVSGEQMFFGDRAGLLEQMARPGTAYFEGLKQFERRLLLANIKHDRSVAFYTSFITEYSPFRVWDRIRVKYIKGMAHAEIGGVTVRPKFVDLTRSYKLPPERPSTRNRQEATPILRSNRWLRWFVLLAAALILIPFYLPVILCLSLCVSAWSMVKTRLARGPDLASRWRSIRGDKAHQAEAVESDNRGQDSNKQNQKSNQKNKNQKSGDHKLGISADSAGITEHAVDKVLLAQEQLSGGGAKIDSVESPADANGKGALTGAGSSANGTGTFNGNGSADENSKWFSLFPPKKFSIDVDSNDSVLIENEGLFHLDPSQCKLFDSSCKLDLLPPQKAIVKNLNLLQWDKVAVYHDAFNAHDAIVARRGQRANPKATATVYLWGSFLRNHIANRE